MGRRSCPWPWAGASAPVRLEVALQGGHQLPVLTNGVLVLKGRLLRRRQQRLLEPRPPHTPRTIGVVSV
jgi:hypothetical protein